MLEDTDATEDELVQTLSSFTIATETQRLVDRCKTLLNELATFVDFLEAKRKTLKVEHRQFRREIQTDLKTLERLHKKTDDDEQLDPQVFHTLKSSNLPFLEAVWAAAKECRDVIELKRTGQLVDVTAEGGLRWIKVSTITESRLLMEMANKGWEWQEQDSDDGGVSDGMDLSDGVHLDDGEHDSFDDDDDDIGLTLVSMARSLSASARKTRIQYRHPNIELILTRIQEGKSKDIDKVLALIRSLGVKVTCKQQSSTIPPLNLRIMQRMVPDDWTSFTETVNIDCTILLALVSDISHQDISEQTWLNRAIRRQIEIEAEEQLLPEILWPALAGRRLLCTHEAARRMQLIIDTIGTENEKARTRWTMGQGLSADQVFSELRKLSKHEIPSNLRLPIEIIDYTYDPSSTPPPPPPPPPQTLGLLLPGQNLPPVSLPHAATRIAEKLSVINRSVFLFGWQADITTITSNRTVAKQVEGWMEEYREGDEEVGPRVWICPTSRSLVAKEKERRDGGEGGLK